MAMIKCSECGKDISDKAAVCIGCGAPVATAAIESLQAASPKTETSIFRALYNTVGDLNDDGKVDAEDFKIAAARAQQISSTAADEAVKLGKNVLQSDLVKDVAAAAAVGALVAIPIPIVGPIMGATVGAGLGVYKNLTK